MKRTDIKNYIIYLLSVFVFIFGLISLLFFPQTLFAKKHFHGKFNVYYDNSNEITGIISILDKAYSLVKFSELFDTSKEFNIFFAEGNIINSIENLQGNKPLARTTANNIFIKFKPDFLSTHFFVSDSLDLNIRSVPQLRPS